MSFQSFTEVPFQVRLFIAKTNYKVWYINPSRWAPSHHIIMFSYREKLRVPMYKFQVHKTTIWNII